MEGLIEGILSYSRVGRTTHAVEQIDIRAMLDDIIELMSPPEGAEIRIDGEMPTLQTERLPLQQVFMNLIGNSVKHAGPGATVGVSSREVDGGVEFLVRDDGPGIAPEYHDRIWGIFQTLEARDRVEGAGIGLAVVKKIVESRGGRVWLTSRAGEGAAFGFFWPTAQSEDEAWTTGS